MGQRRKQVPRKVRTRRALHGGRGRASRLSAEERSAIARLGAEARWRGQRRLGPEEFGDVLFEPEDTQIRLTMTEPQEPKTWTREDVEAVQRYLRRWQRERRQRQRERDVPLP
jgi:hypothetical protein